jgi:alkylation response protein AidB-like acyl-CoA dehydrogenase
MDVAFSDDQELLRKSAREFLEDQSTPDVVVETIEKGAGSDAPRRLWDHMSELGWMGIGIDETYGGLGLTHVDVAVLAEEMGRALLPVPWFSTVALAAEAITVAGTDEQKREWLPKIASGEVRATMAVFEQEGRPDIASAQATARSDGGEYRLDGTKAYVPDLEVADLVVITAMLDDQPAMFLADAHSLSRTSEPTLDETRKMGTLALEGLRLPGESLLGGKPAGLQQVQKVLDRATAILSAEMCGGSEKMLNDSVEYAKVRHQFGRPIGSFQGVSHRCSEMLLQIEAARSLTYYAAWCCDEDAVATPLAVSSAKASASDCYRFCSAQAIQIHGGIGFTWEANLHLWYRRAFWSAAFLGDAIYHRARVVDLLNL